MQQLTFHGRGESSLCGYVRYGDKLELTTPVGLLEEFGNPSVLLDIPHRASNSKSQLKELVGNM